MTNVNAASNEARAPLSQREFQVLELAAKGLTDKEIAAKSKVSIATVRTYWDRIRNKLGALNRGHAIALGMPHNKLEEAASELSAFILRNIQDEAIFMVNGEGIILSWNKGVENLLGWGEREWVGKHQSIFFIPEEKEAAMQEIPDAYKAGASVNDRWHLRKDGSRFWGTNTMIRFDDPTPDHAFAKIVRLKAQPPARG